MPLVLKFIHPLYRIMSVFRESLSLSLSLARSLARKIMTNYRGEIGHILLLTSSTTTTTPCDCGSATGVRTGGTGVASLVESLVLSLFTRCHPHPSSCGPPDTPPEPEPVFHPPSMKQAVKVDLRRARHSLGPGPSLLGALKNGVRYYIG